MLIQSDYDTVVKNELLVMTFRSISTEVKTMHKKCKKYEGLFIFADNKTLAEHIEKCPDCQAEHEKMQRVSDLLQEVKPFFIKKRKQTAQIKIACAICAMILSGTVLGIINFNTDISDTIRYGTTLSAEDLGLPVDAYGLILVE